MNITLLFPPEGFSDSSISTVVLDADATLLLAFGTSTLFQSSPSATISAIKDPTFISLASSGTCKKKKKKILIIHQTLIKYITMIKHETY